MIRHWLTLAWNRRGKNALIGFEVLVAFLVSIAVTTGGLAAWTFFQQPLGFDYRDTLVLTVQPAVPEGPSESERPVEEGTADREESEKKERRRRAEGVLASLRSIDGVVAIGGGASLPLSSSGSRSITGGAGGRLIEFEFDTVTDSFAEAMDLHLFAGRWFSAEDDGARDKPVVINRRLAEEVFGSADPLGKDLLGGAGSGETPPNVLRVVGVIDDYRKRGDLAPPQNFLFYRNAFDSGGGFSPALLIIEFDPTRRAGLERRIEDAARAAAPGWSFSVASLSDARRDLLRIAMAPLLPLGLVGGFLLSMVAMGLAGVFWQSIAQRRSEIGLRRAAGATARDVIVQIVGEVLALVTLSVIVGLFLALQVPLFGLSATIGDGVYLGGVAIAVVLIYLLAALAALPPAWLAARIEPADALRAE